MSLMKFSTKYNVSRLTDADQPNSPVRLCNRNFCVLSTGCDLICASATENAMHRLCPHLHVVPLRKRPFWFLPSPMVATWLAWYNIPCNTRLWGQLGLAALSNLTASSVSKLCSTLTVRSSRLPGPCRSLLQRQDIQQNLFAMVSVWLRRCTWRCLTSYYLMQLFLSKFLLGGNANSVQATASGGVPGKTASRSPFSTCCATNSGLSKPALHVL